MKSVKNEGNIIIKRMTALALALLMICAIFPAEVFADAEEIADEFGNLFPSEEPEIITLEEEENTEGYADEFDNQFPPEEPEENTEGYAEGFENLFPLEEPEIIAEEPEGTAAQPEESFTYVMGYAEDSAVFAAYGRFPEGSEMIVDQCDFDGSLMKKAFPGERAESVTEYKAYNISFTLDGEPYDPGMTLKFTVIPNMQNPVNRLNVSAISAYESTVAENEYGVVLSPEQVALMKEGGEGDRINYVSETFYNVFDIAPEPQGDNKLVFWSDLYTPIVIYRNGFDFAPLSYVLKPERSVLLSSILKSADLGFGLSDIAEQGIVYLGDPELISLELHDLMGDWEIRSAAPFSGSQTLKIIFRNGCVLNIELYCAENETEISVGYKETYADWAEMFSSIERTGDWAKDVVKIAETQLGYAESKTDYILAEDHLTRKGYTRYGGWYGNEYGDWCAMFCSFCMFFAGVDSEIMPYEQNCARWIDLLKVKEKYYEAGSDYTPKAGDLIFFSSTGAGADHVGIVYANEPGQIITIEGNNPDAVKNGFYLHDDARIIGYGEMPGESGKAEQPVIIKETYADWEEMFRNVELTGSWPEDVARIAETQLGYTESETDYILAEDGVTHKGYTRYGGWYGNEYGDWCAMFCSFCMNFAGVDSERIPFEQNCERWIGQLKVKEQYYEAGSGYTPKAGDLIFFDTDRHEDGTERTADHVGIIYKNEPGQLITIEGNNPDTVAYRFYLHDDARILGYAEMPERTEQPPVLLTVEMENGLGISAQGDIPRGAALAASPVDLAGLEDEQEYINANYPAAEGMTRRFYAYDISLRNGDGKVEPAEGGKVNVTLSGLPKSAASVLVLHLVDKAEEPIQESGEQPVAETDMTVKSGLMLFAKAPLLSKAAAPVIAKDNYVIEEAAVANGEVSLTVSSFSTFIFTVDFSFDSYSYSMEGESELLLSDLFVELNIEKNIADIVSVEFSDETLVKVEPVYAEDGTTIIDWNLISLAPFASSETLTITFTDESILVIDVTDEQDNTGGQTNSAPPPGVVETGWNDWQILTAAQGGSPYQGNLYTNKIPFDNDNDGLNEIYLQKNVVPTDDENRFLVYLSIDRMSSLTSLFNNSLFVITTSNGPNPGTWSDYSGIPGNVTYDIPAVGKGSGTNSYTWSFRVYDRAGGTLLFTYTSIRYGTTPNCNNGSVFIKYGNRYLCLRDRQSFKNTSTIIMDLYLDDLAIYNDSFEYELTGVVDQMGDYVKNVNVVSCDGSAVVEGDTLTWTPVPKEYPELRFGENPTTSWDLNVAELVYAVELDVEKEGFISCADNMNSTTDDDCSYNLNDSATLTYRKGSSGTPMTADFPVPYVRGLLYDLWFRKVDEEGTPLQGAQFKLKLADGTYLKDGEGNDRIFISDVNGLVGLNDLPQGKYTGVVGVEEVQAPPLYEIPDDNPWTIPLNYTDAAKSTEFDRTDFTPDDLHDRPGNMRYTDMSDDSDWEIENNRQPGEPVVFKKIDADTSAPVKGVKFALYGSNESGEMNDDPISGFEELTSDENGIFSPENFVLAYGIYFLKETAARRGYKELTAPIRIEVTDQEENAVTVSGTSGNPTVSFEDNVYTITVENEKKSSVTPTPPPDPQYPTDDPAEVTLSKQIDYLGDNEGGEDMADLYRLYLNLETESIEPMDLLLVIDQSNSMNEDLNGNEAGSGRSRQSYVDEFLNGTGSDGFIARFLDANDDNRLAILTFGSDCSAGRYIRQWDSEERSVSLPDPEGVTNYAAALDVANDILAQAAGSPNRKVMIFLSDGVPTIAYADGGMHRSFTAGSIPVGSGDSCSYMGLAYYIDTCVRYFGTAVGETVWNLLTISGSNTIDDNGSFFANLRFADPYVLKVEPADHWPATYDFTTVGLEIPGTNFPQYGITDQEAFDDFKTMWSSLSDDGKLAWVNANMVYPGEVYDIFYLTESAFAQFSSQNTAVPVYTMLFSASDDILLPSGRPANEVLKYMSGPGRYYSCANAEAMESAIRNIAGLSNVQITDPLSDYVDVAAEPQLEIRLTNAAYSDSDDYPDYPYLYRNGAFTNLGALLLDTTATKIDVSNKTVEVVFKPEIIFNGEFFCEASFNVRVNETAYETYAEGGYNATGDLKTDYPGNYTSSGERGFCSNNGADAKWTYYGSHNEDYDDPVVQLNTTTVYMGKVDFNDSKYLAGAEFNLYREYPGARSGCIIYTDEDGDHYLMKLNTEPIVSVKSQTWENCYVPLENLSTGNYWLFETKAPDGYLLPAKPVYFEISEGLCLWNVINADPDPDAMTIDIWNTPGYRLPETGGKGVSDIYATGALFITCACIYGIILKRKRERGAA